MSFTNGKNKFDYCIECEVELLPSNRKRTNPKSCYKCRGIDIEPCHELKKVSKEALNPNSDESDGGNIFEDDVKLFTEEWSICGQEVCPTLDEIMITKFRLS